MRSFVAVLIATQVAAYQVTGDLEARFVRWAAKHSKEYKTMLEFGSRLQNWIKTEREIMRVNNTPGETVTLGHNQLSDLSDSEYRAMLNYKPKAGYQAVEPTLLETGDIPKEINWIEKGAVNEVQDQANCGSCWAFSAVASIEGQHFVQTGELLKLSEQQCVDCDSDSHGCGGGWQDNCMWYVQYNGGISLEKDYPYKAYNDLCYAPYNGPVDVTNVHYVKGKSEEQLLAAIAQGPVSVTVDADSIQFRSYQSGVITSDECGTALDHAVVAVGYGTDEKGQDYYLVRNSWGTVYGDKGYLKIGRGGEDSFGVCGIQEISLWPATN